MITMKSLISSEGFGFGRRLTGVSRSLKKLLGF